jgi:hypothetical protein
MRASGDVSLFIGVKPQHSTFLGKFPSSVLFHFVSVEKGNDPETAEATMEGLAFPNPPSRAAGSEEAGRRSCLSFPANVRKIDAGKRVLSRREGGLGNGVKNPDGGARLFPDRFLDNFPHMKWKRLPSSNHL